MATNNRKCLACSTAYRYCPSCSRADKLAPAWKSEFCSEPCATLWATLTKFGMSMLTKSEAKSIISELDLKPIDAYVDCVKRDYNIVMAEDKKPKRGMRIKMNPIDEAVNIAPDVINETLSPVIESHEVVIEKENE